jgi:hypothetical protein
LLETQKTTMFSPANLLHLAARSTEAIVGQFDLRTALTCARDENIRRFIRIQRCSNTRKIPTASSAAPARA